MRYDQATRYDQVTRDAPLTDYEGDQLLKDGGGEFRLDGAQSL